jgi:hypothetical protein
MLGRGHVHEGSSARPPRKRSRGTGSRGECGSMTMDEHDVQELRRRSRMSRWAEGVPPATSEGRAREIDGELHGGN